MYQVKSGQKDILQLGKDRLRKSCLKHDLEALQTYELVEFSICGDHKKSMGMMQFVKCQKDPIAIAVGKVDRLQKCVNQKSMKETHILDGILISGGEEASLIPRVNQMLHYGQGYFIRYKKT